MYRSNITYIVLSFLLCVWSSKAFGSNNYSSDPARQGLGFESARQKLVDLFAKNISFLKMAEVYGSLADPGVWLLILVFNLFNAQLDNTFPTTDFRLKPSSDYYKLNLCPRTDLAKCLYYGMVTCLTKGKVMDISSLPFGLYERATCWFQPFQGMSESFPLCKILWCRS
jgi:hypothetical protein